MKFIHKDLVWHFVLLALVCVWCGIFGWIGLLKPELMGWPVSNPFIVQVILIILGCMPILAVFAFRLHLRAYWVYCNSIPRKMQLQIEVEGSGDSTNYFAILRPDGSNEQSLRVPVYPPRWKVKTPIEIISTNVFFDPVNRKPLVIEVDDKRLWSMAL